MIIEQKKVSIDNGKHEVAYEKKTPTKIAAAVLLGALAAVALVVPLAAQQGRNGQLHIVKIAQRSRGFPARLCPIVTSNLPELPAGTRSITTSPRGQLPVPVILTEIFSSTSTRASGRSAVARWPTTMPLRAVGFARYPMERDRSPDLARASLLLTRPAATGTCIIGTASTSSIRYPEDKRLYGTGIRYRFRCVLPR